VPVGDDDNGAVRLCHDHHIAIELVVNPLTRDLIGVIVI
jgi:hypothetical protein